ncbi:LamG domain-containing protein [Paenibacillus harenae]|uniref:LamG domain-containing protein n=1 Tax=Paenibacillus harenae TaxID=306543 RepID=UPI00040DD345|nr:LamG domain-containing protein [Paenibacillus harenae]
MSSLRQGLVGEYLFDGSADDTSGHGYHGKVEGAALTANRFGESNRAYSFSGQGDFIVLDPPPPLYAEALSVSVWVKYDGEAAMKGWNNAIISQDDHGCQTDKSRRVFQLSTKGEIFTWHRMLVTPDAIGKQPIQRGVWYHVVAVFDGDRHRLFINGELQDEKAGFLRPNPEEPIFFGKKNSNEQRFWFHGELDDIRIYNRAVFEEEVLELYTEHGYRGDPGFAPLPPSTIRQKKSSAKKWVNKPIRVRRILDRQPFNWNDCYNSFAMALYGAFQYSNKPISLPQALVYSGQAFAINTDKTVSPMDVFGDGSLLRAALDNLGFDMEVLAANLYDGDWDDETVDKALYLVRDSLQRGMAVVGWNLDNYEHGLIYGYDDKRRVLNIHDINARNGGELSYDDFGRRSRNGVPINPEMFVLVLRDRNEARHLNVTRYTKEEDRSYREGLKAALSIAIRHMDDNGWEGKERRSGIAAIDAWITAFEDGSASPFGTSYNLLWITSARQYLIPFFTQSAITHCMSIQNVPLQQMMMNAADVYLTGYRAWVGMRELFPFPKSADPSDPILKSEAIRLLREARKAEAAGLGILREIVAHLS